MSIPANPEDVALLHRINELYDEYIQADIDSDEETVAKIEVIELTSQYEEIFERQNNLLKSFVRVIPDFPICAQIDLLREGDINYIGIKSPYIFSYFNSEPMIIDTSASDEIECYYGGLVFATIRDKLNPDLETYSGISMKGFYYLPNEHNYTGQITDYDIIGGLAPLGLASIVRYSSQLN